jgi:glycosyltransferase involved in cell wall biosynthesis
MMRLPCLIQTQVFKFISVLSARSSVQLQSQLPMVTETPQRRKLFVDISVFAAHDAGTGIQRVVREVLNNLTKCRLDDFDVVPIAAERNQRYKTVPIVQSHGNERVQALGMSISPIRGDIFLGLDLTAHILPRHWAQILKWKRAGVCIHIVIYDLLPVLRPEWFTPKAVKNFDAWLTTIAVFADRFHCISKTVKSDLTELMLKKYNILLADNDSHVFPLGSNLRASDAISNLKSTSPKVETDAINFACANPTALMVGTIEPRKGHAQVIEAFIKMWEQGSNYQLIIVGTPGWKTELLQTILCEASVSHKRLLWLKDADDALLEKLYRATVGVIAASEGEGYGLPLVEADFFDRPVLARDIPVFREVARGSTTFFPKSGQKKLTPEALKDWMETITSAPNPKVQRPIHTSWETTTSVLLTNIGISNLLKFDS